MLDLCIYFVLVLESIGGGCIFVTGVGSGEYVVVWFTFVFVLGLVNIL